jgi:hypothetical protein
MRAYTYDASKEAAVLNIPVGLNFSARSAKIFGVLSYM